MMSACTNPILYGFLNEHFKKEFAALLGGVMGKRERRSRKKELLQYTLVPPSSKEKEQEQQQKQEQEKEQEQEQKREQEQEQE